MTLPTDRELVADVLINAPVAKVWSVLTDFSNLVDASPELVAMVPMLPGGLRKGQQYAGINRRGWVVWPTRNVIREVEPKRALVWDTTSSGARWIFELAAEGDGTRLTQRRPLTRQPAIARVFARTMLGGLESHDSELDAALDTTLGHLKQVAEA